MCAYSVHAPSELGSEKTRSSPTASKDDDEPRTAERLTKRSPSRDGQARDRRLAELLESNGRLALPRE
jgi:hypothetical protein